MSLGRNAMLGKHDADAAEGINRYPSVRTEGSEAPWLGGVRASLPEPSWLEEHSQLHLRDHRTNILPLLPQESTSESHPENHQEGHLAHHNGGHNGKPHDHHSGHPDKDSQERPHAVTAAADVHPPPHDRRASVGDQLPMSARPDTSYHTQTSPTHSRGPVYYEGTDKISEAEPETNATHHNGHASHHEANQTNQSKSMHEDEKSTLVR